jgi:hypothetical protein
MFLGSSAIKLGELSRYSDGLRAGRPGFDSQQGQEFITIDLHSTSPRPVHPDTYPEDNRGSFTVGKAAGE